jgi:hypothetical protein
MNTPRSAAIGTALLTAAALTLSGCGPSKSADATKAGPSASPTPSPTPAAKDQLTAAMKALASTSEKFSVKVAGKQTATGAADVPDKAVQIALTLTEPGVTVKFEMVAVGADEFGKWDLGATANRQLKVDPKKWYKIDPAKVTDKSSLVIDPTGDTSDPLEINSTVAALSNVTTTDGKTFTGTVDLTANKDSILGAFNSDNLDKYGDKVKAVPFTATVNSQGQLATFSTNGAGIADEFTEDVTFSDFGAATVTAPPASVSATTAIYSLING